jgi:hypothetical protein
MKDSPSTIEKLRKIVDRLADDLCDSNTL